MSWQTMTTYGGVQNRPAYTNPGTPAL